MVFCMYVCVCVSACASASVYVPTHLLLLVFNLCAVLLSSLCLLLWAFCFNFAEVLRVLSLKLLRARMAHKFIKQQ